jgi:uncharacterized protein (DUF1499 family)
MRPLTKVVLVVLIAAGVGASLAWPRLNRVETGRTPEYPDLQPREYAHTPSQVGEAVPKAISSLGWTWVGGGKGKGGSQTQATTPMVPFDVFIHVKPGKNGRAVVSVKSEGRWGPWDFGQNARNIRKFLAQLDISLGQTQ